MVRDPLRDVADAPLFIVPRVLEGLRGYRPRLEGLAAAEFEHLRGRLLEGIEGHPTKFWVMQQFQKSLEQVDGDELEKLMDILGIASSDGVLGIGRR